MSKRLMILVGICSVLSAGAFQQAYSQASTPTDSKPKPQEQSSSVPSMPQGPPNQKAVQKNTSSKPAGTGQTAPGTAQADKATLPKNAGASSSDADYQHKLAGLPNLIVSNIRGCIPCCVNLKNPDCVVVDVSRLPDGTTSENIIPRCDPAHRSLPCWRIEVSPQCSATSKQSISMTVDRPPSGPPPNTTAQVSCATVP